jgi:glycogen phosphorylase
LIDSHGLWAAAWRITRQAMSYTNHTLLPEALETWPVALFERLLPRHLELIFQINERLLADVRLRFPGDEALVQRVSLIDEANGRRVRMAGSPSSPRTRSMAWPRCIRG